MYYTVIRYVSFVVMHNSPPNSHVCMGLLYAQDGVISENDCRNLGKEFHSPGANEALLPQLEG